ncbi:MAG: alpha/beta fold hydrolase [Anaerolineae bacterium]
MAGKRWSSALWTLALGTAGLAAANAYLAAVAPPLVPCVRVETKRHLWKGFRVAWWEAGPAEAPAVLLLHGHGLFASAFDLHHLFEALRARYHVYLVDLIGYGLSARPPLDYTAEMYEDLIAEFASDVIGSPAHVVAQGLSAAHVTVIAARGRLDCRSVTLINPAGIGSCDTPPDERQRWAGRILRAPIVGQALFNGLTSKAVIRQALRHELFAHPGLVTDALVDRLYATAHQPGARYAPAAYLSGTLNRNVRQAFAALTVPVTLIWGRAARQAPVTLAQSFLALNDQARLSVIDDAGDLPALEQPMTTAEEVKATLTQLEDEATS